MDEVTVYKESGVTISMTKYIKKEQVRNNGEKSRNQLMKFHLSKLTNGLKNTKKIRIQMHRIS